MSGILDNKQRIMDTIVTLEGRRQIADGKLKVEYVSFTDNATFYSADLISGSADPTSRLYFENCHLPQDQITFEADDSGKLKPFKNEENIQILGGKISVPSFIESTQLSGSKIDDYQYLSGSEFASTAETLLASSINNFKNLYVIGTKDSLFLEEENLKLSKNSVTFNILESKPLKQNKKTRFLVELPSIFHDKSFSKSTNFRYLPPINKINDKNIDRTNQSIIQENVIGNYASFRDDAKYDFDSLMEDLKSVEDAGYKQVIQFDSTSINNKLVSQFFEITQQDITKLDVVEFGSFRKNNKTNQVFFVGKVLTDDNDTNTFIKMFTLIFE